MVMPFYSKWYSYLVLVTVFAVLIGAIFSLILGHEFGLISVLFPSLINTAVLWGGSMAIVKFVWRKYPWEQKPVVHLFVEIGLIVLLLFLFIVTAGLVVAFLKNTGFIETLCGSVTDIVITTLITFLIVTVHEAIFFYKQWKFNFSKSVRLEKDNIEAQYNALKAQVNPHFLFNSLNSLMMLLENHPVAEQYVQDLSDYLRYVLICNTRETVTLAEELEMTHKYINLQKHRFGDNVRVTDEVLPEAMHAHVPPLAVQMLVENCINHNVISGMKPLLIKISSTNDSITVENNLQPKQSIESTGNGLRNIEGRYRLEGAGSLKIVNDGNVFAVTLPLIKK